MKINGSTGEKFTFDDIKRETLYLVNCLRNYGIVEDDVIIIISENRLLFLIISLATTFLNATIAPLNIAYNKGSSYFHQPFPSSKFPFFSVDIENSLKTLNPKLIFVSEHFEMRVIEVGRRMNIDADVIILESFPKTSEPNIDPPTIKFTPKTVDIFKKIACTFIVQGSPESITQASLFKLIQEEKVQGHQSNIAPFFNPIGFLTMILNTCSAGDEKLSKFHKMKL